MKSVSTQSQLPLPEYEIRFPELYSQLKALPKIDLHRHLTGSMRTETIIELARRNKIQLPTYDKQALEKYVTCPFPAKNFREFMKPWLRESGFLFNVAAEPEDFSQLTYEAIEDAYGDNVKYLEFRTSPFCLTNGRKLPYKDVLKAIKEGIDYAEKDFGIAAKLIVSTPRHHWGWEIKRGRYDLYMHSSLNLIEACLDYKDKYIVGFDLLGMHERAHPAKMFGDFFTTVKKYHFNISIHAGETGGAESIRDAINLLHADRIAHGLSAFTNDETSRLLREKAIPLEICPTSNIRAGIINSFSEHPIKKFHELGVIVTVNTDDPQYFKIKSLRGEFKPLTLTDEYYNLITKLSFSIEDIKRMILNALDAAFVGISAKEKLRNTWFSFGS